MLLLRHAKSDWGAAYENDHGRPLNKRGRRAARTMGRLIAEAGLVPDAALSSDATRAVDTLRRAMSAGGWSCPVEELRELYEAPVGAVIGLIAAQRDDVERLLVVGHQPWLGETARVLMGGGSIDVPTAALLSLELVGPWSELGPGRGELTGLVTPAMVEGAILSPRR